MCSSDLLIPFAGIIVVPSNVPSIKSAAAIPVPLNDQYNVVFAVTLVVVAVIISDEPSSIGLVFAERTYVGL